MDKVMTWIVRMICLTFLMPSSSGIRYMNICKWSNEGCTADDECCSRRCSQSHPGTNLRCEPTDMGGLCLYSFHCGLRMECGERNRCCASHWGTCSKDSDCCMRYHLCQKINGFVYRKCLPISPFLSNTHALNALPVYIEMYLLSIYTVVISCIL